MEYSVPVLKKIDLVKFYEKLDILKNKSWSNNGGKHTDGYFYFLFFIFFCISESIKENMIKKT